MKKILTLTLITIMILSFSILASAASSYDRPESDSDETYLYIDVDNPYVEWVGKGFESDDIDVDADKGFNNSYIKEAAFIVRSTTTYDVDLTINAKYWSNKVKMNKNNDVIQCEDDYASAFDVSVLKRNGSTYANRFTASQWTAWQNLSHDRRGNHKISSGTILRNQENTLPASAADDLLVNTNQFYHYIQLALVLVDNPNGYGYCNAPTAGNAKSPYTRRFEELPDGKYKTYITVTVTESF